MEHLSDEDIVLLALGEHGDATDTPAAIEHLHSCDRCARELAAYRNVIELARDSADQRAVVPPPPPASVWTSIVDELGIDLPMERPAAPPPATRPVTAITPKAAERQPFSRRMWLLAAAAVIAVGAGIGVGIAIGRSGIEPTTIAGPTTQAELAPLPTGPTGVSGTATVQLGADGSTLSVVTDHLPLRQGFYQVWLYDAVADKMVPIGTLGQDGRGSWTLADSIDLRSYNVVDVSAQQLNGNPAHGDSVLRGTLTR